MIIKKKYLQIKMNNFSIQDIESEKLLANMRNPFQNNNNNGTNNSNNNNNVIEIPLYDGNNIYIKLNINNNNINKNINIEINI